MRRVRSWFAAALLGLAFCVTGQAAAQAPSDTVPVIERVEPTSGPPGTVVHVIGRRFGASATVQLGPQSLPIVDSLPNRISVRIPDGAPSDHIAVTNAAGTVRGPEFRVTPPPPPPAIEAVDPKSGPPGSSVVIRGKNFSPRLTGNVVTLGGAPVIVSSATPVELKVIVPETQGSAPFVVRVEQAGEAKSAAFEVSPATRILGFEPERAGPGAELTIRGSGFSKTAERNRVYLNSVRLAIKSASDSTLVVLLPEKMASGKLLVDVQGAGRAFSDAEFVIQRPPKLTELSPQSGPPGTIVTVRGTNLGTRVEAIEAKLGDAVLVVREARDTKLELVIPEGAPSAPLSVRVNGVGPALSDKAFVVTQTLKLTSFAPQSGPAGTEVVITGEGFGDAPGRNRVTIGGQLAPVLEATPERLKIRVPKAPSGPIHIQVPGAGEVRSTGPFVVTVPPKVTGISPLQGPVGTQLQIAGEGFGKNPAVLKVLLGDQPLAVESVRDDLAVVRVTAGAKSGRLKVSVPLQGAGEAEQAFEVVAAPAARTVPPPSGR